MSEDFKSHHVTNYYAVIKYIVLMSEGTEDELAVVLSPYSTGNSLITFFICHYSRTNMSTPVFSGLLSR